MNTGAIMALASDCSGNNHYNTVIRLKSDANIENLEYLAHEIALLVESIPGFSLDNESQIAHIRNQIVKAHAAWVSLCDISEIDASISMSAIFNPLNHQIEFFSGRFATSEGVFEIERPQGVATSVFVYVTKVDSNSASGECIEKLGLGQLSQVDLDCYLQNLILDESVIEITVSEQDDLIETGLNVDLLLEKYEKPHSLRQ